MINISTLEELGFSDKKHEYLVVPEISKKIIRAGDKRETAKARSFVFRHPETPVFIDIMTKEVWSPMLLRCGRGLHIANMDFDKIKVLENIEALNDSERLKNICRLDFLLRQDTIPDQVKSDWRNAWQ